MLEHNEPSGKCNGECPSSSFESQKRQLAEEEEEKNNTWWTSYDTQNELSTYKLPFIPGGKWNFDNMTLSLNATHPSNNLTEYDLHSLYGHVQGKVTKQVFEKYRQNERLFIPSQSTFAGSGANVQHMMGGNSGLSWEGLRYSIAQVMNSNMFGIPMTGPETCGDTDHDQELCARWMQLATFLPYARFAGPTQPYDLDEPYRSWARNAMYSRLQFSWQLYTCLYTASIEGGSCFDPVLMHFPEIDEVFEDIEKSFIFANAIMVTPVLQSNVTSIRQFFPNGNWVSMYDFGEIIEVDSALGGKHIQLSVSKLEEAMPIAHLMPGKVITFNDNSDHQFKTATDLWTDTNHTLVMNPNKQGFATGRLFADTGLHLNILNEKLYEYYQFDLKGKTITKTSPEEGLSNIYHYGLKKFVIVNAEKLDSTDFACWTDMQGNKTMVTPAYNSKE